jgi:hypothetical protein
MRQRSGPWNPLPYFLVAPLVWELDVDIERALHTEPTPTQCPAGRLYVPSAVRDCLLYLVHTSPSSGHPGIGRTVRCLSGMYWWPTLAKDVRVYVSSCSVCSQCKAPRHLPRGKLQTLPVPQRPWIFLRHKATPRSWSLWIGFLSPAVSFLCTVSLRLHRLWRPCSPMSSGTTGCLRI